MDWMVLFISIHMCTGLLFKVRKTSQESLTTDWLRVGRMAEDVDEGEKKD